MQMQAATVPQNEAEMAKVRKYLEVVATRGGVPEMWIEDCVQEMLIAIWKAPVKMKATVVAHTKAIDFVRQFGLRGRREVDRAHASLEELDEAGVEVFTCRDEIGSRLACLDAQQALQRVSPSYRRLLCLQACGYPPREISRHLGRTVDGITSCISFGRRQFREAAC